MNTRTMRGLLVATAVLTLSIGACKKKPKDDKAKADGTMDVMKAASMDVMTPAMKADAMKADAMKADAMKADAMKADAMDAKGPVAKGGGFLIKFDRPLKVGHKFKVVTTGTAKGKTTVDGKPIPKQSTNMTYAYEAVVTVKAVHATSGKATGLEVKIIKLQATEGGATKDLLPADTLVLAEAVGEEEKFSVKGKPVAKPVAKVLGYVIDLFDGDATTTDEVFGPGGPKKPGDFWKPNAVKMIASLKSKFKNAAMVPKPSDVTGKVSFVAAKKVDGMDVFQIVANVKINNIAPKMGPVKATAGTLEIGMAGWLPKDPKVVNNDYHAMFVKMHVEGDIKKGPKTFKLVVDFAQTGKKRVTPIK
jgi:pentapeptide MXKDX repeat protein